MRAKKDRLLIFTIRFLKWFCPDHLYDEIEGDLFQKFNREVKTFGEEKAKRRLLWNVIRFFRPGILLRNKFSVGLNGISMLGNYFSISFRMISRNRMYSALNIFGLALGIAAFLFIVQYVLYEKSYDTFHLSQKDLYRISYSFSHSKNGVTTNSAMTPPRVAAFMKEMMPEVKSFARVRPFPGLVISYNDIKFREDKVLIVDPDFLNIFTFPLISGDPEKALKEIRTVVLSERAAKKYFGDEQALGKIIGIDGNKNYRITGVIKDVPENSHLRFDFLISYETIKWWTGGEAETNWFSDEYYSYVLLAPSSDLASFYQRFETSFDRERGYINRSEGREQKFRLFPIVDIHLYSKLDKEPEPDVQGDADAMLFLIAIGFFILLIAWINYINLFTARAMERAKEVGIRKTIGAFQAQLVGQFMVESLVMNCLATIIAIAIVSVSLSYFNMLTSANLSLVFLTEFHFWKNVTIFVLVGSIMAGLYPAFVLSSYRPVAVLKGKLSASRSGVTLRRSLGIFQFAASVVLIACTMIVYMQLNHMKSADLGFDMNKVMVVRGPGVTEEELTPNYKMHTASFVNELLKYPEIKSVTGGSTVPGKEILDGVLIKRHEDPPSMFQLVQNTWVGYDYFSTLDIKLIAGRSFRKDMAEDSLCLILNTSAVKALGFSSPEEALNQKISVGSELVWTLIGVVDDFHQMSLHGDVKPMFFSLYTIYYPLYIVRFENGDYPGLIARMKKMYERFYPRDPFDYFFMDEFFNRQYHKEQKFSQIFTVFAVFAIVVSCIGLFGLSSYSTRQRTKEIGIRKVLGANLLGIAYLLLKEFIILVGLANIIAWPVIYFAMDGWLNSFAERISIKPAVFLASGLLVLFTAIITVSYKTIITAKADPVKALRYE